MATAGHDCDRELALASGSVAADDFEWELGIVRSLAASPVAGVFGPGSVSWLIDRETSIFLGAGRAILLQLAHPWVAAAIAGHSRAFADPLGRFHRTFAIVHAMMFGSLAEAEDAARRLHRRHAAVRGTMPATVGPFPAGSAFRANDVAALRWVHATLADTALQVHELVHGPLARSQRERYWAESRTFARLFGVPGAALPATWDGFRAYFTATLRSPALTVGDQARAAVPELFGRRGAWPGLPGWFAALTARLMPERLRREYGMSYGERERRVAERSLRLARAIFPRLPGRLRFVGPYQEALARIEGAAPPDLGVRLANRLWIGRAHLGG